MKEKKRVKNIVIMKIVEALQIQLSLLMAYFCGGFGVLGLVIILRVSQRQGILLVALSVLVWLLDSAYVQSKFEKRRVRD
jgi:hypothetical protein